MYGGVLFGGRGILFRAFCFGSNRVELGQDGLANAIGWARVLYGLQKYIGLAGASQPRCTVATMLDVSKQLLPLAGCDLVINIAGY